MAASHYELDNLVAIVDRNRIQNDRFTDDVMRLEPLADKWRAFGWRVLEIDGHDMGAIVEVLEMAAVEGQPTVVIAKTVKGKGSQLHGEQPCLSRGGSQRGRVRDGAGGAFLVFTGCCALRSFEKWCKGPAARPR